MYKVKNKTYIKKLRSTLLPNFYTSKPCILMQKKVHIDLHAILSNASYISRNTPPTPDGGLQSKEAKISWTVESNWYKQESEGQNPELFQGTVLSL